MKLRAILVMVLLFVVGLTAATAQSKQPKTLVSFNPIGPIFGVYQGSYEQAFNQHLSFFVVPSYFNFKLSVFGGTLGSGDAIWSVAGIGGVNYYFKTAPKGFYAGGGLGLGYAKVSISGSSVSGVYVEPLAHVGYRFIWGIVSLAPEIGVHYDLNFFDLSGIGLGTYTVPSGFGLDYGLGLALAF